MNCFLQGNSCLWILIILLILGSCSNVFNSSVFTGCGWPIVAALAYCMCKNGTLGALFGKDRCGCGCGCNG